MARASAHVTSSQDEKNDANRRRQMDLAMDGRTAHAHVALQAICLEIAQIENKAGYKPDGVSSVT